MFELELYYQRERVQRQMHDLLSSIASNLTVGQFNALVGTKGTKGKQIPPFGMGDVVDMQAAK